MPMYGSASSDYAGDVRGYNSSSYYYPHHPQHPHSEDEAFRAARLNSLQSFADEVALYIDSAVAAGEGVGERVGGDSRYEGALVSFRLSRTQSSDGAGAAVGASEDEYDLYGRRYRSSMQLRQSQETYYSHKSALSMSMGRLYSVESGVSDRDHAAFAAAAATDPTITMAGREEYGHGQENGEEQGEGDDLSARAAVQQQQRLDAMVDKSQVQMAKMRAANRSYLSIHVQQAREQQLAGKQAEASTAEEEEEETLESLLAFIAMAKLRSKQAKEQYASANPRAAVLSSDGAPLAGSGRKTVLNADEVSEEARRRRHRVGADDNKLRREASTEDFLMQARSETQHTRDRFAALMARAKFDSASSDAADEQQGEETEDRVTVTRQPSELTAASGTLQSTDEAEERDAASGTSEASEEARRRRHRVGADDNKLRREASTEDFLMQARSETQHTRDRFAALMARAKFDSASSDAADEQQGEETEERVVVTRQPSELTAASGTLQSTDEAEERDAASGTSEASEEARRRRHRVGADDNKLRREASTEDFLMQARSETQHTRDRFAALMARAKFDSASSDAADEQQGEETEERVVVTRQPSELTAASGTLQSTDEAEERDAASGTSEASEEARRRRHRVGADDNKLRREASTEDFLMQARSETQHTRDRFAALMARAKFDSASSDAADEQQKRGEETEY